MKPFNLEEAKAGKPLVTRGGQKARFIAAVAHKDNPIIVAIQSPDGEVVVQRRSSGRASEHFTVQADVFMADVEVEKWVVIYKDTNSNRHFSVGALFDDESTANQWIKGNFHGLFSDAVTHKIIVKE